MVNVDGSANITMTCGVVSRWSDESTRDRGNIVVTTYAIPRMKMILLEHHVMGGTFRSTLDARKMLLSLSTLTGTTQEVVAYGIGDIIGAREKMTLMKGYQIIRGTRIDVAGLTAKIVHSGKAGMRQPLVPEKNFLLSKR
jgi:hypothetical protein